MRGDTRDSSHERPPPREREGSSFPCRTIPTGPQAKPVSLGSIKSTGGVEAASASTIQTFKLKTRRIRRIEPRKKEPVEPEPPPSLDDNSDDLEVKDISNVKVTSEVKVTRRKRCSSSVSQGEELDAEIRVNGQDLDSTCSDEDKEMLAIKNGPRDLSPNGPQSLSQELSPMSLDPASLSPDLSRSCDPSPSLSHDLSTSSSHDWDDLVSQESWEHSDTSGDVNHNKENVEDSSKKMAASAKVMTSYDWFDECEREEQEIKKQEVKKQDVKENGILGEVEDWSEENDEELEGGAKFMSSIRKCARQCKEEVVSFKRISSREDVRLSRDSGSYSVRYSKGAISRGRDYELSSQKSNYSSRAEKCQGYRSELGTSRSEKYHGYGYKREQVTSSSSSTAAKYAKLEYDGVTSTLHHPSRRRYDSAGDDSSDGRIRSHHVATRGPRTLSGSDQYRISSGTTRSMPDRRSETSRSMPDRPRTVLSRPRHRSDQTVDYSHTSASSSVSSHREDREYHCDDRILDVESARLRENTNDSVLDGERRGLSHRNDSQCVIRERTADGDSDCDVNLAIESCRSTQCSSNDKHRSVDRRCNKVTGRSRTDQTLSARDHNIIDKTLVDTEPICAKNQCQEGDRDQEPRDQEGRDSPQTLQGLERDSETSEQGDSESDLDAGDCDLVAADDTTRVEASIVSTEDEEEEEEDTLEDTESTTGAGGSTERILVKRVTASCSVGDLDSSPEQEPEEEQGILCTRSPSSGRTLSTRHSPPHGGATNVPSLPKTVTFAKNVKPADSDEDDDHVTYRQPIRAGLGYRGPIRSKRSGSVRFEGVACVEGGVACVDGGGYHCTQDYPGGLATVHHLHHLPVHPHHIQGGIATAVVLPVGGGHPQVSPPLRNIPSHHTHAQVSPPLRSIPSSHAPGTTTVIPVRAASIPSPPMGAGSFNPSPPTGVGSAIPKRSYLSLPLELDSSEVDSTTSSTDLSPGGPPSDTPSPSTTYCTAGTRTLQPGEVYYFSSNSSVMCVQRGKLRPPTPPTRLQRPSTPPSTRIQVGYLKYTSLYVCHLFS